MFKRFFESFRMNCEETFLYIFTAKFSLYRFLIRLLKDSSNWCQDQSRATFALLESEYLSLSFHFQTGLSWVYSTVLSLFQFSFTLWVSLKSLTIIPFITNFRFFYSCSHFVSLPLCGGHFEWVLRSDIKMLLLSAPLVHHCLFTRYLVHTGDALNYLYLVCNGSMEVLQNDMVVAILGKGDLVGCDIPISLVPETLVKSSSEVKALTYCDLKSIHISGLLEVLRMYPEFAETFCTEIVHDLTFNLREGYQMDPDLMLHGAHSLTLPSISEDDEEDEDEGGGEGDHDDYSGSGSPPSSPSTGGGPPVTVCTTTAPRRRTVLHDNWDRRQRNASKEAPLIQGQHRKPALKFCNKNSSQTSKSSNERTRFKDSQDVFDTSRIDRIDSQLNSLSCEMSKMTSDMRLIMEFMRQMCNQSTCDDGGTKLASDECRLVITEPSSPKCSSLTSTSSCSQLLAPSVLKVGLSSKYCQTERSLIDDFLTKISDSGSPPPNSGYSSSSSNEEKVKYLIHCQNRGVEGDTESISDDSVLRPSNSLTIQSMSSSRDVSPFKGSRTSFSTQPGDVGCLVSPSPSPRPVTTVSTSTCTVNSRPSTNLPPSNPLLLKSSFSHQIQHFQQLQKQTNQQQQIMSGDFSPQAQLQVSTSECTIDIESQDPSALVTASTGISKNSSSESKPSMSAASTTSSNRNHRNLPTEF